MAKVILYIATSQDGFIADKNGGVDWLPQPTDQGDEFGYEVLMKRISSIVMGSTSYKQILGFGDWAWKDKTTYVFSSRSLELPHESISHTNTDVGASLTKIREEHPNQDIWLLGGAKLAASFAKEHLIDECIITLIPTTLGEGIKLELPYDNFTLTHAKSCSGGMIQKFYEKR
jgi:dihydrofolate reductase